MKQEITKLRSRFAKHYDLGHGQRQAVLFPMAVHFRDQNEWKDINNTLEEAQRGGKAVWRSCANPMSVEFACNPHEDMLARIEHDGHVIEWGFAHNADNMMRHPAASIRSFESALNVNEAENTLPQTMFSGIDYANVNPGVSVRYTMNGMLCKEDIIVESRDALVYTSVLLRSNDLSFRAMDDNSIEAFAGENVVFRFTPPVVSDSSELKEIPVSFTLTETADGTRMDYILDEEFLNNAVFPITIDPSVELLNEIVNLDDTYLRKGEVHTDDSDNSDNSDNPEDLPHNKGSIFSGWYNDNHDEYVSLIRFKELIPLTAADTIVKAELSLAVAQTADTAKNPKYVGLYEVLKDWNNETVTWENFDPNCTGNISNVPIDCIIRTDSTRVSFDITNLYRSWYHKKTIDSESISHNFGVALRRPYLRGNSVWNYTQFYTRNYSPYSAPTLTVTYVSHVGLEKRWDYEGMSAGRAGSASVGVFNGNSVISHPDIAMDGLRKPISVGHFYNSCECNENTCFAGNGWRTSMHQCVHIEELNDDTYYVWTDGDGTRHYFLIEGSSPYSDEDGMNLKLTYTDTTVTITDLTDNVMVFTKQDGWEKFWITDMHDCLENTITVSYLEEGKIDKVTDPVGRYIRYFYSTANLLNKLQAFEADNTSADYPHCTYTYSAEKNLTKITYSDLLNSQNLPDSTVYNYNGNLLTKMTNYDSQSIEIEFEDSASYDGTLFTDADIDPALRVVRLENKVNNMNGAKLLFDYRHMSTHVTRVTEIAAASTEATNTAAESTGDSTEGTNNSEQGKKLIYQFNDRGNLVAVRDELGYAAYATYGEELPNHADKTSRLQRTVVNTLRNHSFETADHWTTSLEGGAAGTHSFATDQRMMGGKAAKMVRTNADGAMRISQNVEVTAGRTYTLSCYMKTSASAVKCTASAVCGGVTHNGLSMSSTDEWSRISVTFTAPDNASTATVSFAATGAAGSAWFDCAQLEEGEVANRYNIIENGDFRLTDGVLTNWTAKANNLDSEDYVYATADPLHPTYLGENVLHLTGCPHLSKGFYQEINASGSADDLFVVGGWSKGRSRPTSDYPQRYAMQVQFYNSSSAAWSESAPVGWNEEWTEWHYASGMVKAPVSYSKIRVYIEYEYNINEAEFDGIALYKEAFGEQYTYNDKGLVRNVTTMSGSRDIRLYDSNNNLSGYSAPGAGEDHYRSKVFDFDDPKKKHLMRYENSPMNVQDVYEYDDFGNMTAHKRQDTAPTTAIRSTTAYSADGNRMLSQTDPRGLTMSYEYNSNGTVKKATMPNGQAVSYEYDAQKRVTATQATNTSGTYKNTYGYENDRLKTVSHNTTGTAQDVTYTFEYDAFGKPTTVKVGSQPLSTNVYDDDRQQKLRKVEYGNGQYMENEYDEFGRLTGVKYSSDTKKKAQYFYGANGQAAKVIDNEMQRVTWSEFDEANRPKSLTMQDTYNGALLYKISYSYDAQERVSKLVENEKNSTLYTTTYEYDWDNRPTELRYGTSTQRVKYTYDGQGRIATRRIINGSADQTATFSYLASSVPIPNLDTVSSTNLVSSISQPGVSFSYGYAANTNNIVSETRTGGSYAGTTTYQYDSIGQLIRVNSPTENATWVYTYDLGGNILNKKKYAYTTGALGAVLQTIPYTYSEKWKDQLATYNGQALDHDEIGNLLSDGRWTYTWVRGRLLRRMYDGTNDIYYTYDQNGMRVRKTVNGAGYNYRYTNGKLSHLYAPTYGMHFFYDGQGKPSILKYNGSAYFYLYNLQGDVIGIVDWNGNLVVEYNYDAWGKVLAVTGSMADTLGKRNPIRYRGYFYDEETGLYYLKSRYYNAILNRFISADFYIGRINNILSHAVYTYCRNKPVTHIDSCGTEDEICHLLPAPYVSESILAIYEYKLRPDSLDYTGKIYILQYDGSTKIGDYVVEGTTEYDVIVIDNRFNNLDPELIVQDSGTWGISAMFSAPMIVIDNYTLSAILHTYNKDTQSDPRIIEEWGRTKDSLSTELWCHQFAYSLGLSRNSTEDTNLNRNDEGNGLIEFFSERYMQKLRNKVKEFFSLN